MKKLLISIIACVLIFIMTGCYSIRQAVVDNQQSENQGPESTMNADTQTTPPNSKAGGDITTEINDELVSIIGMNYLDVVKRFGDIKDTMWFDGPLFMHENLGIWLAYDNLVGESEFEAAEDSNVNQVVWSASSIINRKNFSEKDFDSSLINIDPSSNMKRIIFEYKNVVILIDSNEDGTVNENSITRIVHSSKITKPKT